MSYVSRSGMQFTLACHIFIFEKILINFSFVRSKIQAVVSSKLWFSNLLVFLPQAISNVMKFVFYSVMLSRVFGEMHVGSQLGQERPTKALVKH
ncbi:Histone-like DNA-binding protein [Trichinella spiralis]|uniref:Histone-like DNA-binding protein n=1 Tax=Trichinella spiralis TaxID=6334 RepID=A0ABR3KBS7_TRISP